MKYIAGFVLSLLPGAILAHDLGAHGSTWPIDEINMKQAIAEQSANVNWSKLGKKLKDQASHIGTKLPGEGIPLAQETKTRYIDPSISLSKDIYAKGRLIYKKGTLVNPLDHTVPSTNMLFFDAKSSEQKEFALKAYKLHPYRIMLVVTNGDPVKISKEINHPVFFAYPNIKQRFEILEVPTMVGVAKHNGQMMLANTTIAQPFEVKDIDRCWSGCDE